ncbi:MULTISPECIES: murein biosynthesis integral membrane protein MurJ [Streptomyces]|uniref:murein biosynthesis integral membrane protein MurJ n=1 Tax=Streptomyces TaxID=1883 RepID=UPI0007DB21C1|nr:MULTISPECIES: murein biosynthesis integral membrane protein MurJ [unclassified Streptomyces]MDN3056673.1 murein biosynthesis integral membrane protein MurJ [Streptomyces sp. SRF1]
MNAPYDGEGRVPPPPQPSPHGPHDPYGQEPHQRDPYLGDAHQVPPADPRQGYGQQYYPQDPYLDDSYATGSFTPYPYPTQDSYGHDPLTDPLYDRHSAHAPQQGGYPEQYYQQPPTPQGPDPRVWPSEAAPGHQGAAQQPYTGGQAYAGGQPGHGYPGGDDGYGGAEQPQRDAFAHLYRDQQPYEPRPAQGYPQGAADLPDGQEPAPGQAPVPGPSRSESAHATAAAPTVAAPVVTAPAAEPQQKKPSGGRAGGLLQSSALMAAGTLVSRLTGFLRQMVIVAGLGAASLGQAYQIAYQLPAMVYFLTVGGGLNSVFVPQLVRAMKEDDDGGVAYANRLLTLTMVVLGSLVAVSLFAAPALIRMLSADIASDPPANEVAVTFARYCLPTIFFMGVHVVVGQILNARGKFGAMMWTPVLNNIVVIATFGLFIWVFGTSSNSNMGVTTITPEGIRLLGLGTLLGLTVQALAMFPYLRAAGFRFRPRFDWRGHGLGKAAKLAKWTVLFVLANQAGNIVVTQLATAAGTEADNGGHPGASYVGYTSAQLIWNMPQAIITVSVMAALLPRLSRAAHDGDPGAVRDDISQGLRTSAVAIVPLAFGFIALGIPLCTLLFGTSGTGTAQAMGYILMAFGLGLIPFSVQYVVLRGFYAYEDTRTPFYNTVIVAAVNAAGSALAYVVLPARWAVAGMAAAYGLAYAIGVGVAWKRLRNRLGGDLDGPRVVRTYTRLTGASIPAALLGGGAAYAIMQTLGMGIAGSLAALLGGGLVLVAVFYIAAKRMRVEELTAMVGMVRGRLGR